VTVTPSPGTRLPTWRVDVEAAGMRTMAALLRDPNPIHFDVGAVRQLGLGDRPINQGPTNVGYIVNMLLTWRGGEPSTITRLTVRFTGNVFAGDRLVAGGEVVEVRTTDSGRTAVCDVWLDRDDGVRVVSGSAEVTLE
jgi:acyl dehydratase